MQLLDDISSQRVYNDQGAQALYAYYGHDAHSGHAAEAYVQL